MNRPLASLPTQLDAPRPRLPQAENKLSFLFRQEPCLTSWRSRVSQLSLLALLLVIQGSVSKAEDTVWSDGIRPYLHWRVGEFAPAWDVLDLRGISVGADLDRRWSVELSLDAWQLNLEDGARELGEQQVITLGPQVRYRVPLWNDRVVPYALAGVGGTWIQFNDRKDAGFGRFIDADGITYFGTVGLGVDYFLARNIALNLEGKYVWSGPIDVTIDDNRREWDASSFLATLGLRIYFDRDPPEQLLREARLATPARFYFGTQGGLTAITDSELGAGIKADPKLNALGGVLSLNYTLSLGVDLGEHLGLELGLAHTEYSLVTADQGAIGEYSVYSAMPMLRLRYPIGTGRWVPYFLAGAGIAYAEFNDVKPAGDNLNIDAKGVYPAIAVGAGTDYFLARNLSLNFEGRWRHTWNHEVAINPGPDARGDISEFQFTLGFRAYLFEWGHP